jgi:putative hemolysin
MSDLIVLAFDNEKGAFQMRDKMSKQQPKIRTSSLFLLAISLFFLAGCGGSPTSEPSTAVVATTEATSSQWSSDPAQNIHVTNLGGDQVIPKIVAAANGDFYVAWFSNPDEKNYNVRLQRYDANGNALWEQNGLLISDKPSMTWITDYVLTRDNENNAVLVFQDVRNGPNNIYAYKISPEGEFSWGRDGIPLSNNEYFEAPSPDSVTMPDSLAFVWVRELDPEALVLQKVKPDGTTIWGDDGLVVQGQAGEPYSQPVIASGGGDHIILIYGIEKQPGSQIMTIYAQKLDGDGDSIWNGGQPISLHDSVPFFIRPSLVSDGAGGAYVSWYTTELKGFVQHLDADGQFLMPEGGAPLVASGTNLQIAPDLQFSPEKNELFVFWTDTDEGQSDKGLSGQKMSPTGELLWGDNGRNYVEMTRAELNLVTPHLTGDNIVVFYAHGESAEDRIILETRIKATLVSENGDPVWEQPAVLSAFMSDKGGLEVDMIRDQEWVAVWSDSAEREILMQNLPLLSLTQLANPASVYCVEQGGTLDTRTDDSGGQYGVCVFEDGSECEEWAFCRGECKPGE